jgi:hypothetical protein
MKAHLPEWDQSTRFLRPCTYNIHIKGDGGQEWRAKPEKAQHQQRPHIRNATTPIQSRIYTTTLVEILGIRQQARVLG